VFTPTKNSIQVKNPNFRGLSVSDSKRFIAEIGDLKRKQQAYFANIERATFERLASVTFNYFFAQDDKMFRWDQKRWAMVFTEQQWLIIRIGGTIKCQNIETLRASLKYMGLTICVTALGERIAFLYLFADFTLGLSLNLQAYILFVASLSMQNTRPSGLVAIPYLN